MDRHPIVTLLGVAYTVFKLLIIASLLVGIAISQQFRDQLSEIWELVAPLG